MVGLSGVLISIGHFEVYSHGLVHRLTNVGEICSAFGALLVYVAVHHVIWLKAKHELSSLAIRIIV